MACPITLFEIKLLKAVKNSNITKVQELLNSVEICETKLNDERYFDYYLIIKALSMSEISLAKLLIEKGFRVYKESEVEKTILDYAVCLKDIDLIKAVLEKGGSLDILTSNKLNKTLFHEAIYDKNLSIIELFLSHVDVKTFDEKNLLHYAIEVQNTQVIEKLVEKKFSLTKANENKLTPFCIALKKKNYNIVNCLLSRFTMENIKLDYSDDIAPAYVAIITGNIQIIKNYIDSGLPISNHLEWDTDPWSCLTEYSRFTLLHCAVKHLKLDIVEFLLSLEVDICVEDKNGSTPLHAAYETKEKGIWATWEDFHMNNSIIDHLLKANMNSKSNPINKNGLSHFHIACSRDESTVVEHFLKVGAPINQPVSSECYLYKGFSPLHFAAKFRCVETLKLLLKNGADVKQRDFKKRTALHIASKEPCLDGVRLLLQYGADTTSTDSQGNTPVHLAFEKKNYEIIDVLLSVQKVAHSNPANTQGLSHFHIACTRNNVNIVKNFIDNGAVINTCVPAQLDKEKKSWVAYWGGYSPLHFAVSHNRSKVVQLLLHSGANIGIRDSKGFTPLHAAFQYDYKMFSEFIKNILCDLKKRGMVSLQLKPITDITKVNEDYVNGFGVRNTIGKISWASHRAEHLKIINSLLNYKSDINCLDNNGNTPLFYACAAVNNLKCVLENHLSCSKRLWDHLFEELSGELHERRELILNNLLKLNVNLDQCYKNGSILHYICSENNEWAAKMMDVFLKKGANVNAANDKMLTPLHQAISIDNKNFIRMLLDYDANVNCVTLEDNSTPLLIAALKIKPADVVKELIVKGANVNARQSDGRTALHNFAQNVTRYSDHVSVVISELVKAGANINSRDSKGLTPLHIACLNMNYVYVVVYNLLKCGADVNIEDNEGKNIFCYMYEKCLENPSAVIDQSTYWGSTRKMLAILLQNHIIKMNVIGLSISKKVSTYHAKCNEFFLPTDQESRESKELINKCEGEVQCLKDEKINAHNTLYNVIFKDENTLSTLVKDPTFKSIIQSKSFNQKYPIYGVLVQLQYQKGVIRSNLLPPAKCLLNKLTGQNLPDECSEHIFSFFRNAELKESIEALSGLLDFKMESSDDGMQLRTRRTNKRQKVY